ncbi:MAG TPA: hypothetical protein VGJ84_15310 [Polyangiaceae bacterium]
MVETDLGLDHAEELAQEVETAREIMIVLAFGRSPPAGPKIRIIAMPYWEFQHYNAAASGAFASRSWFEPVIVLGDTRERASTLGPTSEVPDPLYNPFSIYPIAHELGHALTDQFISEDRQPRWFAEGIATYLESAAVAPSGKAYIGRPPEWMNGAPAYALVSIDELWAWRDPALSPQARAQGVYLCGWSPLSPSDPRGVRNRLYLTAWATVRYLTDDRPADFEKFQAALSRGEEPKAAYSRIFPDLYGETFKRTIAGHLGRGLDNPYSGVKTARFELRPARLQQRVMSNADVLGLRASLYMAFAGLGGRPAREDRRLAAESVTASLHQDPTSLWGQLSGGFYFGVLPPSVDLAKRAVAQHFDDWLGWLWYADVLKAVGGPDSARHSALSRAALLAPNRSAVLARLEQDIPGGNATIESAGP